MNPNDSQGNAQIEAALQSIAAAIQGSNSQAPDANGWYMYQNGRRFFQRVSGTVGAVTAHDGKIIATVNLPVGMTDSSNYSMTFGWRCANREIQAIPQNGFGTINVHAYDASAISFTAGGFTIDIVLERI